MEYLDELYLSEPSLLTLQADSAVYSRQFCLVNEDFQCEGEHGPRITVFNFSVIAEDHLDFIKQRRRNDGEHAHKRDVVRQAFGWTGCPQWYSRNYDGYEDTDLFRAMNIKPSVNPTRMEQLSLLNNSIKWVEEHTKHTELLRRFADRQERCTVLNARRNRVHRELEDIVLAQAPRDVRGNSRHSIQVMIGDHRFTLDARGCLERGNQVELVVLDPDMQERARNNRDYTSLGEIYFHRMADLERKEKAARGQESDDDNETKYST
jgi:hypothetical protein